MRMPGVTVTEITFAIAWDSDPSECNDGPFADRSAGPGPPHNSADRVARGPRRSSASEGADHSERHCRSGLTSFELGLA